ncbi:hypothetical protein [Prosthecobacter sp.]|uniref:hypothetical protein n=1 Tax=Prosthecobacter sp. TaxID=1965333 RepID=UPI003783C81B
MKILQLHAALSSLSGAVTHMHEGRPVQAHFRFTGATRMAIAKAVRVLTPFVEDHKTAVSGIVKQMGGPWEEQVVCENRARAIEEIRALEAVMVEGVPVIALPMAEFVHDDNPVPPAVLEVLLDHLK